MNIHNISYSQMYYFIQVVDYRNFSRAADALNVSQSTLSKSIQTLEQNLNFQLFHRNKGRLTPTEAGLYLYQKWSDILDQIDSSIQESRWYDGGNAGTLRIGVLDSHRSEMYLIDTIDAFHEKYPTTNVEIQSLAPEILQKKLNNNELDVIFTVKYHVDFSSWEDCETRLLYLCPLEACMKPTNPLHKKDAISIPDLKSCKLIVISSLHLPSYNEMLKDICSKHGFTPHTISTSTNANAQIYNLRDYNDIFICDRYHRDYDANKLIFRPIIGTESGVAMVWKKGNNSKPLRQLIDIISQS